MAACAFLPSSTPTRELLPPLVMLRLDANHARAELYLDAGAYLLSAATTAAKIEAHSILVLVHIGAVTPPPVAVVERILNEDATQATAMVQYRRRCSVRAHGRAPLQRLIKRARTGY